MKHANRLTAALLAVLATFGVSSAQLLLESFEGDTATWTYYSEPSIICDMTASGGHPLWLMPDNRYIHSSYLGIALLPDSVNLPLRKFTPFALVDSSGTLWNYDFQDESWRPVRNIDDPSWLWSSMIGGSCGSAMNEFYFAMIPDTSGDSGMIYMWTPVDELLSLPVPSPEGEIHSYYWRLDFNMEKYSTLWWCNAGFDTIHFVDYDMDVESLAHSKQCVRQALSDTATHLDSEITDLVFIPGADSAIEGIAWVLQPVDTSTWILEEWNLLTGTLDTLEAITSNTTPWLEIPTRHQNSWFQPLWVTSSDSGWALNWLDPQKTKHSLHRQHEIQRVRTECYYWSSMGSYGYGLDMAWSEYDPAADETYLYIHWYGVSDVPETDEHLPTRWTLSPAWPNPFNGTATVQLALSRRDHVTIELFNIVGQRVKLISAGIREPGISTVAIDAEGLASGIYFVRARTHGGSTQSRRITLLR